MRRRHCPLGVRRDLPGSGLSEQVYHCMHLRTMTKQPRQLASSAFTCRQRGRIELTRTCIGGSSVPSSPTCILYLLNTCGIAFVGGEEPHKELFPQTLAHVLGEL